MQLTVNGEAHEHTSEGSLVSLLAELKADPDRVATLVNETIIPRTEREGVALRDGDRVEIIAFAAGG